MKNFDTTLAKIKSRGYWRVEVYPAHYHEKVFSNSNLMDILKQSTIQLRGWDYPHFIENPIQDRFNKYPIDGNRYEAWIDWTNHKEVWRLYDSGKFTHLFNINEQWFDDYDPEWGPTQWADNTDLHKSLDVIGVIYKITEIVEFTNKFIKNFSNENEFILKISINNIKDAELVVIEPSRTGLWGKYTNYSEIIKAYEGKILTQSTQDKEWRLDFGKEIIQTIYSYFAWDASSSLILDEQQKLLNRKL